MIHSTVCDKINDGNRKYLHFEPILHSKFRARKLN